MLGFESDKCRAVQVGRWKLVLLAPAGAVDGSEVRSLSLCI